jgi:hypothetical protein
MPAARFDRVIRVACGIANPFRATDRQIDETFARGYEQGMRVAV